jgi:hypothetical protein
MRERGIRCLLPIVAIVALFACPTQAAADGLPILGVDASRTGLTDSSGFRYVTLNADGSTVVARTEVRGGKVSTSRVIDGRFTIPAVAYDGSPSGLAADGRTLVLVRPRIAFPQRQTTFAVIDTAKLRVRDLVTLKGDYSFDAVSPDGSTIYLIEYLSSRDPTRYEVRAYDLTSSRLLPEPIVDPSEPDERMAGMPVSRAASPDGRWAYTLYDGNGHEPFIHALDTVEQRAVCVDLPQLEDHSNLFALTLQTDQRGRELTVLQGRAGQPGSRSLLSVNTRSYAVSEPSDTASPAGDGDPPWLLIGALGAVLGIGFALVVVSRRESTEKEPLKQT